MRTVNAFLKLKLRRELFFKVVSSSHKIRGKFFAITQQGQNNTEQGQN